MASIESRVRYICRRFFVSAWPAGAALPPIPYPGGNRPEG
jgi:hypothetical protein